MQKLNSEKATHLLRQLPYKMWMRVGILNAPKGIGRIDVGSLDELLWSIQPSKKSLVVVNHEQLETWLRESVQDEDFAQEIQDIRNQDITYIEISQMVYEATQKRVAILKSYIEEEKSDETMA